MWSNDTFSSTVPTTPHNPFTDTKNPTNISKATGRDREVSSQVYCLLSISTNIPIPSRARPISWKKINNNKLYCLILCSIITQQFGKLNK